jgi:hypothetical protein
MQKFFVINSIATDGKCKLVLWYNSTTAGLCYLDASVDLSIRISPLGGWALLAVVSNLPLGRLVSKSPPWAVGQ